MEQNLQRNFREEIRNIREFDEKFINQFLISKISFL